MVIHLQRLRAQVGGEQHCEHEFSRFPHRVAAEDGDVVAVLGKSGEGFAGGKVPVDEHLLEQPVHNHEADGDGGDAGGA